MITYLAWMPLGFVVAKFYAKYTSLDVATIGIIILVGRLFDAFTDPLLAYASDRFDTRWGRRKPWIVLSAPVFATGFALLAMPPQDIHWSYFFIANVVLYSGWTFFEITHIAWGLEFERNPERRANLGVLLKFFAYLGSLAFFAYPFMFNPDSGSSEFTPPVMAAIGITVAVAFPALALLATVTTPREIRLGNRPFELLAGVREIAANRHFLAYLSAYGLWALADGLLIGLYVIYVDAWHDLAAHEGLILLGTYFARVIMAPAAIPLLRRFPGKSIWSAACLANVLFFLALLFIPTGEGALASLIVLAWLAGFSDCVIGIVSITLLGSLVDEDALGTGRDKAASYKAFVNLAEKILRAIGISGGLLVVGMAGLRVGEQNSSLALSVLVGVVAAGPAVLNLASALIMRYLPGYIGGLPGRAATGEAR